jgi:hypothetical protein
MTQMEPATVLATAAAAASLGAVNTDLFVGPVRKVGTGIPRKAAFFLDYGGPAPEPYLHSSKNSVWAPRVQVTLRDEPTQSVRLMQSGRAFLEALHLCTISGVIDVLALQGSPTPLGLDGDGCPRVTLNFQIRVKQR